MRARTVYHFTQDNADQGAAEGVAKGAYLEVTRRAGKPLTDVVVDAPRGQLRVCEVSLTDKEVLRLATALLASVPPRDGPYSRLSNKQRIHLALRVARQDGQADGAHHKAWVIDQMVRILTGDGYEQWVALSRDGEDGPETYDWDTGVAP